MLLLIVAKHATLNGEPATEHNFGPTLNVITKASNANISHINLSYVRATVIIEHNNARCR